MQLNWAPWIAIRGLLAAMLITGAGLVPIAAAQTKPPATTAPKPAPKKAPVRRATRAPAGANHADARPYRRSSGSTGSRRLLLQQAQRQVGPRDQPGDESFPDVEEPDSHRQAGRAESAETRPGIGNCGTRSAAAAGQCPAFRDEGIGTERTGVGRAVGQLARTEFLDRGATLVNNSHYAAIAGGAHRSRPSAVVFHRTVPPFTFRGRRRAPRS